MRVLLDVRPTYQRLVAIATGVAFLVGCGDKTIDKPLPKASEHIAVNLPWKDGGRIPRKYTCEGAGAKPAIRAKSPFAIVMTDPDAPSGTFVHWTAWDGAEGENSFGKTGYSGPCPPEGDAPHHYVVTVYALRRKLDLPKGTEPEKVLQAVQNLAVGSGSKTGLYGR